MKTKINIIIDSQYYATSEQQLEMLAYIRIKLQNFTISFPETSIKSLVKPNYEEIMEAIRNDNQTMEDCYYFDEAEGRHKCTNDLLKSNKCEGVCKHFWTKNKLL